jgi:hypothetical protein
LATYGAIHQNQPLSPQEYWQRRNAEENWLSRLVAGWPEELRRFWFDHLGEFLPQQQQQQQEQEQQEQQSDSLLASLYINLQGKEASARQKLERDYQDLPVGLR